jgi:hypothetical protein
LSETPSRAISTACAWRSWCGAKRRRTPAWADMRRSWVRAAAGVQGLPRVCPSMTQNSVPTGISTRRASQGPTGEPGAELVETPLVHADLTALAALARANQHRAAGGVEVGFPKGHRLADSKAGSPEHDDLARARRSVHARVGHGPTRRPGASPRRSPRPEVSQVDSGSPCCAVGARRGNPAASPANGAGQPHREAAASTCDLPRRTAAISRSIDPSKRALRARQTRSEPRRS